jgi:hypothetical protein
MAINKSMTEDVNYRLRENSFWAKIAAYKLGAQRVALVLGSTIHLYNVTKQDFLADKAWVRHELCHIRQYKEHGFVNFLLKYVWESIKKGYYNNKFEVEARAAENNG